MFPAPGGECLPFMLSSISSSSPTTSLFLTREPRRWAGRRTKIARHSTKRPSDRGPLMKPTSARERLDIALGRIDDPKGEGARACLTVYREQAKAAADAADARAKAGFHLVRSMERSPASRTCSTSPVK